MSRETSPLAHLQKGNERPEPKTIIPSLLREGKGGIRAIACGYALWYALAVEKSQREIRVITGAALEPSVAIIRRAFGTVAAERGYTEQNAPHYTAFITPERLEETRQHGGVFWGLFEGGIQAGFVAVEKEPDGRYWMKRLAVLPANRGAGSGKVLVDTVISYVRSLGEPKLYIAVAGDKGVLNDWYKAMGFIETEVKEFPSLPFKVCFMELDL